MRIIHCIYSFNTGGSETMLVDILNQQCKTEEVSLIIINESYTETLFNRIDSRVNIIKLNRKEHSKSIVHFIKLKYILHKLNPDVIHLHNASLARLIHHDKLFFTAHCLGIPTTYFYKFHTIIAISDAVKDDIVKRGNYPVVVIQNGIRIGDISVRKELKRGENFRIIQLGRLDCEVKGQDILIDALSILVSGGIKNIFVDFIGAGHSYSSLKDIVKKRNLEKYVCFLGLKDRDYIYSHLKDYDLMCHPSRSEGFGLAVVEGMAAKIPVLVASSGGPYEIIQKGKYGYSFVSGAANDCADKILSIFNNYNQIQNVVNNAYNYACDTFSIESMVSKYLAEYIK